MSLTLCANATTLGLHKDLAALRAEHNIPVLGYSLFDANQPARITLLGADKNISMRWGSNTKTLTAITLLQLAKAGLVDLDAPLSNYVDAKHWNNPWRNTNPVRVIHLLELTAGFTDLSSTEFNYNKPITLANALALAPTHRTSRWPPGLQHSYSNLTPGLSQLLIETLAGLSYSAAVAKYVLQPLEMKQTNFSVAADLPGGFKADGLTPIPYWHMTFPAYGAMNAPIADVTRLAQSLLRRSQILGETTLDHLLVARSSAGAQVGFTFEYASGLYPRVRSGLVWQGHGGDADGYRSRVALLPQHKRGYVVVINTDNPEALRRIEQRLEEHISNQIPKLKEPARFPIKPSALKRFTGHYYPASTRFDLSSWAQGRATGAEIRFDEASTSLVFTRGKKRTQLLPVTENTFRRPGDPVATLVFIKQGEHQYLQGELGNFFNTDSCPEYASATCRQIHSNIGPSPRP